MRVGSQNVARNLPPLRVCEVRRRWSPWWRTGGGRGESGITELVEKVEEKSRRCGRRRRWRA